LGTLPLSLATLGVSAVSAKRVLMVCREDSRVPTTVMMEQAVRNRLRDSGADGIEIHTGCLYANRLAGQTHYRLFRECLSPFHPRRRCRQGVRRH
jgi:hypothetical protein